MRTKLRSRYSRGFGWKQRLTVFLFTTLCLFGAAFSFSVPARDDASRISGSTPDAGAPPSLLHYQFVSRLSDEPLAQERKVAPNADFVGPGVGQAKPIKLANGRTFIVQLPKNFDRSKNWPLIMVFHGWKEDASRIQGYSNFDRAQAISVYPQGKNNAWSPAPYASTSSKEDRDFVHQIISSMRATYPIDSSRIYAAGMSNGGGFASHIACRMPETFRAVASVSAAYYDTIYSGCSSEPVPRLSIHGTNDAVVDYFGGSRHAYRYQSVLDVLAMDAQRNRCSGKKRTDNIAKFAVAITYDECEALTKHIRIKGGQHVWPGRPASGGKHITKDFATNEILNFFNIGFR